MQKKLNLSEVACVEKATLSPEVFIDEAECLRRVPVSRRTWYSWRAAGKVPTIKCGRRCLYHWASVEAALLRMQRGGGL
jgi:hypothetical protein